MQKWEKMPVFGRKKKHLFLNQIAVYLPFATYLPLCNLLIINLFCNSGKYGK